MKETRGIQFTIREMQPDEKASVEKLFAKSLGIVDRIAFALSFEEAQKSAKKQEGATLVAEYNSEIVGTVSIRIQNIKGKTTGFVDALATDKNHRGMGIASSLVKNAISRLEERGCTVIYATADRYNSPSWNIFVHKGFSVYEIPYQIRDYGLSFLRLWLVEFHFLGFGTFFLRKSQRMEEIGEIREAWHLAAAILGVSAAWCVQPLIKGAPLMFFLLLLAVVALSIIGHELAQKLVYWKLGFEAAFKAWGSGILLNLLFGMAGGFFPAYGSTYIRQIDYSYRPKGKTGIAFAVGPLISLVFAFLFLSLSTLVVDDWLFASARSGYVLNLIITVFNLVPLQAAGGFVWDGKKTLNWSRKGWLLLCVAVGVLVVLDIMV